MNPNTRTRLLSTIAILLIVGAVVFFGYRMIGGAATRIGEWFDRGDRQHSIGEKARTEAGNGARTAVPIAEELGEFATIAAQGGWSIEIEQGDYSVDVTANERAVDRVEVFTTGETLRLEVRPGWDSIATNLTARITLPALERLELDGGADVRLSNVGSERLAIEVNGAASVNATGGAFENLVLDVDGAASIDFSESSVVNANVDMSGAGNFNVRMAGGELTGSLSGVGNVTYSGEVGVESIRIDGLGRVRER
ncbi:MAG: GIN domain-containing protein [Spirochaetota bacterium]